MAKRRFQLPGIQDLSKDQERIRALPHVGQHLIIGGPGTGKSVMALLRAKSLADDEVDYRFLVFNHLLRQSSQMLFGSQLKSQQWQSWFLNIFENNSNEKIPRLPQKSHSRYLPPFDWPGILRLCQSFDVNEETINKSFLIIDEGQDMPPGFYQAIVALGFENLFVVADQNQQIVDGENSSRQDLEDALALESSSTIELRENYRNGFAIARLARHFYTGDPASPPPNLPVPKENEVNKPILYIYPPDRFQQIIFRILQMSINEPRKLIGILCPNNNVRKKYYRELNLLNKTDEINKINTIGSGKDGPLLSTFESGDKHQAPFDEGGVMVINMQACKGLEFDTVFIADIDLFNCNEKNILDTKKRFYVMIARATEKVIMLRQSGEKKPIDSIIPTDDPSILETFDATR